MEAHRTSQDLHVSEHLEASGSNLPLVDTLFHNITFGALLCMHCIFNMWRNSRVGSHVASNLALTWYSRVLSRRAEKDGGIAPSRIGHGKRTIRSTPLPMDLSSLVIEDKATSALSPAREPSLC
jgi:hypothetical protein